MICCFNGLNVQLLNGGDASTYVGNCRFELNGNNALAAYNNTGSSLAVTVADSTFYRNTSGIRPVRLNGSSGVCTVYVNSSIINNVAGITGIGASNSGLVLSRGDNTLINNGNGNAFSGKYSAQ